MLLCSLAWSSAANKRERTLGLLTSAGAGSSDTSFMATTTSAAGSNMGEGVARRAVGVASLRLLKLSASGGTADKTRGVGGGIAVDLKLKTGEDED